MTVKEGVVAAEQEVVAPAMEEDSHQLPPTGEENDETTFAKWLG